MKKSKKKKDTAIFKPFKVVFSYAVLMNQRLEEISINRFIGEGWGRLAKGIPSSYYYKK